MAFKMSKTKNNGMAHAKKCPCCLLVKGKLQIASRPWTQEASEPLVRYIRKE